MDPQVARSSRRLAALLAAGVLLLAGSVAGPVRAAPSPRLPDLRMGLPDDFRLERDDGRRLLRLTTTILNVGDGPFELRARRDSRKDDRMTVRQRIRQSDGTWTGRATPALARYATDGHGHWHIQRVSGMELFSAEGEAVRTGRTIGFCFFDTGHYRPELPRSPDRAHYLETDCGTPSSLKVQMGISVGWGDRYQAGLAYQWIDVTGVPAGVYHVRTSADPQGHYLEAREGNNCSWARIRIPASGTRVTVLERGQGCEIPGDPGPTPTPSPTPTPTPPPTPDPPPGAPATGARPDARVERPASIV
jgi:hypothetical protein